MKYSLLIIGIVFYGLFSLYELFTGSGNLWWVFHDPEVRTLYFFLIALLLRFATMDGLKSRQGAWNFFSNTFFCLLALTALCLLFRNGAAFIASGAVSVLLGLVLLGQDKAATNERISEYIKGIREFLAIFVIVGEIVLGIYIFLILIPSAVYAEASATILDLENRLVHVRMLLSFLTPSSWQIMTCLFAIAILGASLELRARQKYVHWFLKYSQWTGKSYLFLSLLASFTFFGNGIHSGLAHVEAQLVRDVDAIDRGYEDAAQQAKQVFAEVLVEELIAGTQTEVLVSQINDAWKAQDLNLKPNADTFRSASFAPSSALHTPLRETMRAERSNWSQEKISVIHQTLSAHSNGNTADAKEDIKKFTEGFVDILFSTATNPILDRVLTESGMEIPAEFVKLLLEPLLSSPIKYEISRLFTEFLKTTLEGERDLGELINPLKEKLHITVGPTVSGSNNVPLRKTLLYTNLLITKFKASQRRDAALKESGRESIQPFNPPNIQSSSSYIARIIENSKKEQEIQQLKDAVKKIHAHPPGPKAPRVGKK